MGTSETTAVASEVAGKISESLVKKYAGEAVAEATGEVLGALTGGLTTLVIGGILDFITGPDDAEDAIDYTKIKTIFQSVFKEEELKTLTSQVLAVPNVNLPESYFNKLPFTAHDTSKVTWTGDNINSLLTSLNNNLGDLSISEDGTGKNILYQIDQNHPIAGLPIYMYGSSLQLALYQEMAMLLKLPVAPDPEVSFTLNEIIRTEAPLGSLPHAAKTHREAVDTNWQKCIVQRKKSLSYGCDQHMIANYVELTIKDGDDTVYSQRLDYGRSGVSNALQAEKYLGYTADDYINLYYYPKILNNYCKVMGYPDAVRDRWYSLLTDPMGKSNGQLPSNSQELENAFTPERKDYFLMEMGSGVVINRTDRIYSINRDFYLSFSEEGDLQVVCRGENDTDSTIYWSAGINTNTAQQLEFSTNGDLAVTDAQNQVIWSVNTPGTNNYVILGDNGMLQVRDRTLFGTLSANGLLWTSDYGRMASEVSLLSTPGATTYTPTYSSCNMAALVFRQLDQTANPVKETAQISAAASLDGINWSRGVFQLPERMTTLTPPAANGMDNSVLTVFKGNGNANLYLNQGDPYGNAFGGLVELNGKVTTLVTPCCSGLPNGDFGVFYTGNGNTNIYEFDMPDFTESDGTLTCQIENATDSVPARLVYNNATYFIYRGPGSDAQIYYHSPATGQQPAASNIYSPLPPAATICDGKIYMAWVGAGNGNLWYSTFDGQDWSQPIAFKGGNVQTDAAPAMITLHGRAMVYFKGKGADTLYCGILN